MSESLEYKIRKALNEELIRRLLRKYFEAKNIDEDSDRMIYPPTLQDLTVRIPQLQGKVEVVPYVEDMDPNGGSVKLGWNLFVLGTKRMYLGESVHKSLTEIRMSVNGPMGKGMVVKKASPKGLMEFIIKAMSGNMAGFIDMSKTSSKASAFSSQYSGAGQFYAGSQGFERNKPVY